MATLTFDDLKKAGALIAEPVKLEGKVPGTDDTFIVYVKQRSIGDSLNVLAGEKPGAHALDLLVAAMADSLLDEKCRPIMSKEQLLQLDQHSPWFDELQRLYLEVNSPKKKS